MMKPSDKQRRAIVFAPFFSPDLSVNRPRFIASVLAELMPVDVVTSDFDHGSKQKREPRQCELFEKVVYLETLPYTNNVSLKRFLSHVRFAFSAAAYFKKHRDQYDVVYASVPMNVLSWLVFKSADKRTKIMDVIDIWPDVLPFSQLVRRVFWPFFALWKWFFKSGVHKADIVLAVSDRFLDEANKYASQSATAKRFYIAHEALASKVPKQSVFTVAYVGNIGRLYDFETLLDVMAEAELRDKMQLFVIGQGDRQQWLLSELERRKIKHRFFGIVFDPAQLADILCSCQVGFNGFINTVAAFSYKASTYLSAGLPMLNSMGGDLGRLVIEKHLGENYEGGSRAQLKEALLRLYRNGTVSYSRQCEKFYCSDLEVSAIKVGLREFFLRNLPVTSDLPKSCLEEDKISSNLDTLLGGQLRQ